MPIKILCSNRDGEYKSQEFVNFCEAHGIQKQLTIAYAQQQNHVSERKNCTTLNMVQTILARSGILRSFWLEAIN